MEPADQTLALFLGKRSLRMNLHTRKNKQRQGLADRNRGALPGKQYADVSRQNGLRFIGVEGDTRHQQ